MILSDVAFSSLQRSLNAAYAQNRPQAATRVEPAAPLAAVVPIRGAAQPADSGTAIATGLSKLLQHLATGHHDATTLALSNLSHSLQAQTASATDGSGDALAAALTRTGRTLAEGSTNATQRALGGLQNFLLSAGRATGTTFNATA